MQSMPKILDLQRYMSKIPFVRPCIGFLRGGPISEGPQKTELIFAAYSIRHDDAAFLGQVPVPLVLGCYPYSIFCALRACFIESFVFFGDTRLDLMSSLFA